MIPSQFVPIGISSIAQATFKSNLWQSAGMVYSFAERRANENVRAGFFLCLYFSKVNSSETTEQNVEQTKIINTFIRENFYAFFGKFCSNLDSSRQSRKFLKCCTIFFPKPTLCNFMLKNKHCYVISSADGACTVQLTQFSMASLCVRTCWSDVQWLWTRLENWKNATTVDKKEPSSYWWFWSKLKKSRTIKKAIVFFRDKCPSRKKS